MDKMEKDFLKELAEALLNGELTVEDVFELL